MRPAGLPAVGFLQAPPTWPSAPLLPSPPANPRHGGGHNKQAGNGGRSSNPKKVKSPKYKNQKTGRKISPVKNNPAPADEEIGNVFSGSVIYAISGPPPSSLPLPTFFLRPKLRCKAAAGIDSGATDNLRQILQLQ